MGELDTIIKREYDLFSELEIASVTENKVMDILRDRLSQEDYAKVEDAVLDCVINVEVFAFRQGVIRGIAITNGGVLCLEAGGE